MPSRLKLLLVLLSRPKTICFLYAWYIWYPPHSILKITQPTGPYEITYYKTILPLFCLFVSLNLYYGKKMPVFLILQLSSACSFENPYNFPYVTVTRKMMRMCASSGQCCPHFLCPRNDNNNWPSCDLNHFFRNQTVSIPMN